MTALDNDALIAACQLNSPPPVAVHRTRVRHFILDRGGYFMVPAIVLSEYLFKFDLPERKDEFNELLRLHVQVPPFDQLAAEIAADLGKRFAAGRTLASVARRYGTDRICLKADLLIEATVLRHQAKDFVTNDSLAHDIAVFAGIDSHLLTTLPDPPATSPPIPPSPPTPMHSPPTLFPLDP